MESFEINKDNRDNKIDESGKIKYSDLKKINKWFIIIFIIISLLIISAVQIFLSRRSTDFQSRTSNRYPRFQRRNAMREGEIEKLLSKVDKFTKFTENLRKN